MGEIHFTTRQGSQVNESKSARLLRFSSVSGEDARAYRSICEVERSTSRRPTVQRIQRVFLGSVENPLAFEWNIFAGRTTLQILQNIQDKLEVWSNKSTRIWRIGSSSCPCSTILIGQKKKNSKECLSNSEKVQDLRKKVSAWTLVIPRSRRRRQNGVERTTTNLKELLMSWWNISKKVDIQYSVVPVR